MSRAERRLAASELAARLRSQLGAWQDCVARLSNLEEQIDVCFSLQPQKEEDVDLPSCAPLQCLLAKQVDYCSVARTLISRLEESLEVASSILAEETHVEAKLRAKASAVDVKSKGKKNRAASSRGSSTKATTSRDPDRPNSANKMNINELIVSSTKSSQQLCMLINQCCLLLEAVIVQKEIFLNLTEAYPKPSDRTGNTFPKIEKNGSYEEEKLLYTLDQYVKSLSSTKSKSQNNQEEESFNDDSCNYTLDT